MQGSHEMGFVNDYHVKLIATYCSKRWLGNALYTSFLLGKTKAMMEVFTIVIELQVHLHTLSEVILSLDICLPLPCQEHQKWSQQQRVRVG